MIKDILKTEKISFDEYTKLIKPFLSKCSLYHQHEWLASLAREPNIQVFGLKTETENGELVSVTPFFQQKKLFLVLVGSPLRGTFTEYMGPIFSDKASEKLKEEIILSQYAFLKARSYSYIEWGVKGNSHSECFKVLEDLDCIHIDKPTLIINLSLGVDEVWKGFQGRARNMIRKAEKNGVVVQRKDADENDIKQYYSMLDATFKKQGIRTPHSYSLFKNMHHYLTPKNWLQYFCAEYEGQIVAAAIFITYGGRMMYLSGTSTTAGAKLAANNLIQWEAIKFASENGITEYDMGGTGNLAIDKFKKSFGGKEHCHQRWIYKSKLACFAETLYFRLRHLGKFRFK